MIINNMIILIFQQIGNHDGAVMYVPVNVHRVGGERGVTDNDKNAVGIPTTI